MSDYTKITRIKYYIAVSINWILLFLPVAIYVIMIVVDKDTGGGSKVAVVACLMIAAVITLMNALTKVRLRCPIWIILIGLYIAVREFLLPLIIIMAVATILDDFLFAPLVTHYRTKLISAKTFDEMHKEINNDAS